MAEPGEERWACNEDITKDLARLDDFGADYGNYTTEVLTNKGRGSKKKQSPKPGPYFLDPRTGEPIDFNPAEDDENEEEYLKDLSKEVKAELKKSGGCIGRGRPIQDSKDNSLALKKQLRGVRSHAFNNDAIEAFVLQKQAEKLSPRKSESPASVKTASPKKGSNPKHSSDSSSISTKEPNRRETDSPPISKEFKAVKTEPATVNLPSSSKPGVMKRSSRNALISSLLQHMEKKSEGDDLSESLKEISLKRKENESILSEVTTTDDDVVIGSEVGNADDDDDEFFKMNSVKSKATPTEEVFMPPKSFSDMSRESENDILEFKNEFLKNFIQAQEHLDIGKNAVADLEKKKQPKVQASMVFTNTTRSGNSNVVSNNNINVNNNNNHQNAKKLCHVKNENEKYEKLAQRIRMEKIRKKNVEGTIYDIKPDPFFLLSKNPETSCRQRVEEKKKEKEFSLFKADFPSLR